MSKSKLVENNRWKVDTKEKNSWETKKKREKTKRKEHVNPVKKEIKEEINIENKEEFPEFCKTIQTTDKVSNEYLERIKKQKEKDEELNKMKLKPGWIAYRKEKKSHQIKVSRDGVNYYSSLRETYTDEEWEQKEKEEFDREMDLFSYRMNQLYLKRQKESDDYYYETGKLDAFAIVQKEALEYEEYLKKFEEEEEELFEEESEEEDDIINSDNDEYYKRR